MKFQDKFLNILNYIKIQLIKIHQMQQIQCSEVSF